MNKKLLLIVLIIMSFAITSCSETSEPIEENNIETSNNMNEEESAAEVSQEDNEENTSVFKFSYHDIDIPLDVEAEPILTELGESIDYFEAKSCAFPGLDKMYTYPGIEIRTYEKDGVDHIISIILLDDTVATQDGIRLFSTLESVESTYGEADKIENGLYTYIKDDTSLNFLIKDDEVISIEYLALVAEQ